jgi:catechol 2,3-dioxygenase-like lactoylglutathione lyase family enzyme
VVAKLNHTIVWCRDHKTSADFMTGVLGLPPAQAFMHFMVVKLANGVSMDFMAKEGEIACQHYAFLVSDREFDAGFARIKEWGLDYWADPARSKPDQINHHFGGRGVYFEDPAGHLFELITKPYGKEDDL